MPVINRPAPVNTPAAWAGGPGHRRPAVRQGRSASDQPASPSQHTRRLGGGTRAPTPSRETETMRRRPHHIGCGDRRRGSVRGGARASSACRHAVYGASTTNPPFRAQHVAHSAAWRPATCGPDRTTRQSDAPRKRDAVSPSRAEARANGARVTSAGVSPAAGAPHASQWYMAWRGAPPHGPA